MQCEIGEVFGGKKLFNIGIQPRQGRLAAGAFACMGIGTLSIGIVANGRSHLRKSFRPYRLDRRELGNRYIVFHLE